MHFFKKNRAAFLGSVLFTVFTSTQTFSQNQVIPQEEVGELTIESASPVEYSDSRVFRLTDLEDVPRDVWVSGQLGDYRLENDLALFQVKMAPKEIKRDDPNLPYYGIILDVATGSDSTENFQGIGPSIGSVGKISLVTESIRTRQNPDGSASVIVNSRDFFNDFIVAETEYRMPKDMPGVLAVTTLRNDSNSETVEGVIPSDFVQWGGMVPWIPGVGFAAQPNIYQDVEFTFAKQYDQTIMVAPEIGNMTIVYPARETTGLNYGPKQPLAPGETRTWRRWILVSDKDPAFLFSNVLQKRENQPTGVLVGRLIEREQTADGTLIEKGPAYNEEVFITPFDRKDFETEAEKAVLTKPYIIAQTNELGSFETVLPVGKYRVIPAPKSRFAPMPQTLTTIEEDEIVGVDYGVSKSSALKYEIVDENGQRIPGKISIEPLRNTDDVYLGAPGQIRAGNAVLSPYGAGIVNIPPGNYRVTASRGIEYHTDEKRITVREIQEVEQQFVLKKAFDTPGWVGADIGVRTDATESSRVDARTRISSAVAEGVEWLVTGDSNTATNLEPVVSELGLGKFLKTSVGYRHPGESSPFLGDFLLFPVEVCGNPESLDYSSIQSATTSEALLSSMRSLCPEAAILLSRPIWPGNGYLSLNGYDAVNKTFEDDDFVTNFDAIELWEGKRQGLFKASYGAYHTLAQKGIRLTAFGQSNSFSTLYQEVGYPRVYIKSSEDDPINISPEELAENIKNRIVSVTNGPFIEFTANGQEMGSLITDTDGRVDVDVTVKAANWVKINSLSINLNGRFVRRILLNNATADENGIVFPNKDADNQSDIFVRPKSDAILDIIVEGTSDVNMDPVNPFRALINSEDINQGQYPLAISAPIFIDADGDGKVTIEQTVSEDPTLEYETEDPPF